MLFPSPLHYKNKCVCAASIFEEWQRVRTVKVATLEPGGLFKDYDVHKVQSLEVSLVEMDAVSLNYWLTKFIQEVAKQSKEIRDILPKPCTRVCAVFVGTSLRRNQMLI